MMRRGHIITAPRFPTSNRSSLRPSFTASRRARSAPDLASFPAMAELERRCPADAPEFRAEVRSAGRAGWARAEAERAFRAASVAWDSPCNANDLAGER